MGIELDNNTIFGKWAPCLPKDIRVNFFKNGDVKPDGNEPRFFVRKMRKADISDLAVLLSSHSDEVAFMGRTRCLRLCSWLSQDKIRGRQVLDDLVTRKSSCQEMFRDTMLLFSKSLGPKIARGMFSNGSAYIIDQATRRNIEAINELTPIPVHERFQSFSENGV